MRSLVTTSVFAFVFEDRLCLQPLEPLEQVQHQNATQDMETMETNRDPMETEAVLRSLGYSVVGNLGEGGYGMVKLAKSERHSQQVAIKIMDRKKESPEFNTKFLPRELAVLKRVRHPHIIQVHECFEMPSGLVFIVMEAAETELRRKILDLQQVPINQAKIWFTQLLSAVQYLHKQNIAHRDLKCQNVLLTADGQVKLTDFGLGRFSKGFPFLSRTYCGTRRYAAPEVNMNRPYDPKKADVWSLGVIFYAMVTGTMPFNDQEGCSLTELQRKAVKFPRGVKVSGPCRDFISYMLRFNPFKRPSVKQVAQHPWLQSREEDEMTETGDSSVVEAESSPVEKVLETPEKHCEADGGLEELEGIGLSKSSGLLSSIMKACDQNIIELITNVAAPVIVEDADPIQEDGGRKVEASDSCHSEEALGEEVGCFNRSPLCGAAKRVVASISRASKSIRRRIKKILG